jgi:hypothetical protein
MPIKRKIEDLKPMKIEDYLEEIGEENDPKILAPKLFEAINNYISDRDYIRNVKFHSAGHYDDLDRYFVPDFNELLKRIYSKVSNMVNELEADFKLGNDKNSVFLKEFMYDPIDALVKQSDILGPNLERLARYQATGEIKSDNDYDKLSKFNVTFKNEIVKAKDDCNEYIQNDIHEWKNNHDLKASWFVNRFNNGKDDFTEVLNDNKGGFFENLFGTTSKEYKEFSRRLSIIKKEGAEKGDLSGLREAAYAYLKHKFKNGFSKDKDSYIFSGDKFDKLDSTSKGRVRLCQKVLESIERAEKDVKYGYDPKRFVPEKDDNIIDNNIIKEASFIGNKANEEKNKNPEHIIIIKDLDKDINNLNNKLEFQNTIKEDVEENNINININKDSISNTIKTEIIEDVSKEDNKL